MILKKTKIKLPKKALIKAPEGLPFKHLGSGKVREIYDLGENLLIVATDRVSVFDQMFPNGIPGKGIILTQISRYWLERVKGIYPNHLVDNQDELLKKLLEDSPELIERSIVVKKCTTLPIEAITRGYLTGGAWVDYQKTGTVFDHEMPKGLREFSALAEPIFTPTTKAKVGGKDLPLTEEEARELLGMERFEAIRKVALEIYTTGRTQTKKMGLILADTKLEFGLDEEGKLMLIDEVLTPDSSRYWTSESYEAGKPRSLDKQFLRDYVKAIGWKEGPLPELPGAVIRETQELYMEARERLCEH